MDRTATGIPGLDELLQGGFPQGSTVLVSGSTGTGKSILALQYLYYGANNNEPGVYSTMENSREDVIEQASQFGWDVERLENENKLVINVMKGPVSEFACDGVITLHQLGVGVREFRSLRIVKLRKTKHKEGHVPLIIGENGIEIKEEEKFNP